MPTTNQLGLIAETAVIHECAKLGIGVSRPLADERYDLIVDLRHKLLRVQCKWAVKRGEVVVVTCRTNRRGAEGYYLLPIEFSGRRTAIQLRLGPTRNNQAVGINWAYEYEFGATLRKLLGPIAQLGERVAGSDEVAGSSPAGSIV